MHIPRFHFCEERLELFQLQFSLKIVFETVLFQNGVVFDFNGDVGQRIPERDEGRHRQNLIEFKD